MKTNKDSIGVSPETNSVIRNHFHVQRVALELGTVITNLLGRMVDHDSSKFTTPEVEAFARQSARLQDIEYGTPEYQRALDEIRPAVQHHYEVNDHHPEHHKCGILDMDLIQLIEMLADWKAASSTTKGGSMKQSLEYNRDRFNIPDELMCILENTARTLGWLEE